MKNFQEPEMKVIAFAIEDIITTSETGPGIQLPDVGID